MIAVAQILARSPVLADQDQDQLKVLIDKAGPIAMLFVVLLGVALYFLWRSLNKQMKRIDPALPSEEDLDEQCDEANGGSPPRDDDAPPRA